MYAHYVCFFLIHNLVIEGAKIMFERKTQQVYNTHDNTKAYSFSATRTICLGNVLLKF